jgi:hypothetical protein
MLPAAMDRIVKPPAIAGMFYPRRARGAGRGGRRPAAPGADGDRRPQGGDRAARRPRLFGRGRGHRLPRAGRGPRPHPPRGADGAGAPGGGAWRRPAAGGRLRHADRRAGGRPHGDGAAAGDARRHGRRRAVRPRAQPGGAPALHPGGAGPRDDRADAGGRDAARTGGGGAAGGLGWARDRHRRQLRPVALPRLRHRRRLRPRLLEGDRAAEARGHRRPPGLRPGRDQGADPHGPHARHAGNHHRPAQFRRHRDRHPGPGRRLRLLRLRVRRHRPPAGGAPALPARPRRALDPPRHPRRQADRGRDRQIPHRRPWPPTAPPS